MTIRRFELSLVILLIAALPAIAAVSSTYSDWANGPVQYLMTKADADAWKHVTSDDQAKEFVDLFWARRDPSPGTPGNEMKEEFDALVVNANERLTEGKTPGSMTDRGKVLILLGAPSKVTTTSEGGAEQSEQSSGVPAMGGEAATRKLQTWHYEGDHVPGFAGLASFDVTFLDALGNGQFRLRRSRETDDLFAKAIQARIIAPDLTAADLHPKPKPAPAPEAAPAAGLKSDALRAAVDAARSGKAPESKAFFLSGEGVTQEGEVFVPVQFYFPKGSVDATKPVTFFGVVDDASGKEMVSYEEEGKFSASKSDFYFDKSLTKLPAGEYTAILGIASAGTPLAMAKQHIKVEAIAKDAEGVSPLILTNNIFPLSQAQRPTDPFAYGGLKVVPKGDGVFTPADEILYFFEVRNPSTGAGTPKMSMKLDVDGTVAGKKIKTGAPLASIDLIPMKGVEGHFFGGSSIPAGVLKPGNYAMHITLTDEGTNRKYELEREFKVAGN